MIKLLYFSYALHKQKVLNLIAIFYFRFDKKQSHNLGPFRQAGINLSNVSHGLTCQNFKQNGYLHASP